MKWIDRLLDVIAALYKRAAGDSKEQRDAVDKDIDAELRRRRRPKE